MVIMHGIGGLYNSSGQKRAYWEYAEMLAENGMEAILVDSHGDRGYGVSQAKLPNLYRVCRHHPCNPLS